MELWSLQPKGTSGGILVKKAAVPCVGRNGGFGGPEGSSGRMRLVRVSPSKRPVLPSLATADWRRTADRLRASSPGSSSQSIPEEEDGPEGRSNKNSDGMQSKERPNKQSNKESNVSQHVATDWRTFRANLVAQEQVQLLDVDVNHQESHSSRLVGPKWAHPIPSPEAGCVLVATEKLDDTRSFERTVVLLLRVGTRDPKEGPFGVVINRPLRKTIRDMKPSNPKLATTFANCSLHFGGPLHTSMFLVTSGSKSLPGFEPVIPGLCFGARNNLDEAAELVKKGLLKPEDFRFFIGYSGWQLDQLMEEIELNYWYVAACSANLLTGPVDSLSSLWEDVLQLMGGHYSELSRKPRQDST
ncbi:uncharacterized protein LOC116264330 [Nymphaea colorata]|nr:uncharacterized protein LOC116264330 [Nymphaea colorata]